MTDNKKVGPQGTTPGGTGNKSHHQTAATSQFTGGNGQGAGAWDATPEISFLRKLDALGCPLWAADPGYECDEGPNCPEFHRPRDWQKTEAEGNLQRLLEQLRYPTKLYPRTSAVCANMGGKVAVVDADPKNGCDIEKVQALLAELSVRIFAEVATPSGGRHFYIAGHEDLPTVHSNAKNERLPGYPGVDIQSYKANVFLPGTFRW